MVNEYRRLKCGGQLGFSDLYLYYGDSREGRRAAIFDAFEKEIL